MKHSSGRHFFASGRVQGVFYRRFCRDEAQKLGLTGWAKNLSDGRVELKVYGEDAALIAYEERLRAGPLFSKVTALLKEEISYQAYEYFTIY
jgi:acylphosphatase